MPTQHTQELFRGHHVRINTRLVQEVNRDPRRLPEYENITYEGRLNNCDFTVSYHHGLKCVPHANVFVDTPFATPADFEQFCVQLRLHLLTHSTQT